MRAGYGSERGTQGAEIGIRIQPAHTSKARRSAVGVPALPAPPSPWSEAVCGPLDPALWEGGTMADRRRATRLCSSCPIQMMCREEALRLREVDHGVYGVWGGWYFDGTAAPRRIGPPILDGRTHGTRNGGRRQDRCPCEPCLNAERAASAEARARKAAS